MKLALYLLILRYVVNLILYIYLEDFTKIPFMSRTHTQTSLCMINWYFLIISSFHSSFLGHYFAKCPFLSQLNYWVVICPSILCRNVLCSFSAGYKLLRLDFHLFLFFHQPIMHLSICDLPTRTTLLTEFGRPFKVVIYASASLSLSSMNSNCSLRWDLLVK